MLPNDVLKKWWIEVARLGMTPTEAATSIRDALIAANFIIIKNTDPEGAISRNDL